ncbi:lamin tail domain-containing protein [Marinoscillum sp. MHG1-6]|uniref:lamin tail domain-containing protein n=1 Tax=Marinoscillum sp. MHG1-6 TaxID=2959627 RepID=UPI0021575925|nr:lamin tail domain-containing protein [Marinoscillum sp. MHG1-6]
MTVRTTFSAIILCFSLYANAQVLDDFSDGDFTSNPVWAGSASAFNVVDGQLNSNNDPDLGGLGTYYLSTPSTVSNDATWEFFLDLKFATSSANYFDVYLISDQEDLTSASINGYFVRFGDTNDEVVLYKSTNGIAEPLIDAGDNLFNSSSSNPFRIRITRSINNVWQLEYDDGDLGTYTVAGTMADGTFTSASYFGFLIVQSSLNGAVNGHFLDDLQVYEGELPDNDAPFLLDVNPLSSTELSVSFSEKVDTISAELEANYFIDGISILEATIIPADSSQVKLRVSSLNNGGNYNLLVSNIEDISGNVIAENSSLQFHYLVLSVPEERDIVINEFMVDPDPVIALPNAEFIELFNTTDLYFDLSGFQIKEVSATGTTESTAGLDSLILDPGGYLILCKSTSVSLFEEYGNAAGVSGFPSLNQSNSSITLLNPMGRVIDEIVYSSPSLNGVTFEQINPYLACNSESNYVASSDISGGTPGRQNSGFDDSPDIEPPSVASYELLNSKELKVIFNESMDSLSLINGDYGIPGLMIEKVEANGDQSKELTLSFSENIQAGTIYSLQIALVEDCEGNVLTSEIEFGVGRTSAFNEILITEIMADEYPVISDLPEEEYLEIFNATNEILSLAGLSLTDQKDTAHFDGGNLNPGEYLILCRSSAETKFHKLGDALGLSGFPSLNNSGESLSLISAGALITSVTYSKDWHDERKNKGGYALELKDVNNPCGDRLVWGSSRSAEGGTPGQKNSNTENIPDNMGPELLEAVVVGENTIRLSFNEHLDYGAVHNIEIVTKPVLNVLSIDQEPIDRHFLTVRFEEELQVNKVYELVVKRAYDCNGNGIKSGTSTFVRPDQVDSMEVLINEILFNPRTGGVDFVELYNNTDRYFDLKGWQLARRDEGYLIQSSLISQNEKIIAPAKHLALTIDPEVLFIEYPKANAKQFYEMNGMPTYPNDNGTVALLDVEGNILDEFTYDEDFHSSLLGSVDGVSLERVDYDAPTQQEDNWSSASSMVGFATPGYVNSQHFDAPQEIGELKIEPKVFVPGTSGLQQSFTTINYQFETGGKFANAHIYDQNGRIVKELLNGASLSTSGFIKWDGTNDHGMAVRTGYYVVLFEVYDGYGKKKILKETVVVGWN